jgi:hypothetical protein
MHNAMHHPMSLSSVVCQVMEKIIFNSMSSFFHTNASISSKQHGFLSRHSTVTQLLETYHDWCTSVNDRKLVDILFVDFQKAFDSCSHVKLLKK